MKNEVIPVEAADTVRVPNFEHLALGAWVWVTDEDDEDGGEAERWFGCITHVGSNYIRVESPGGSRVRIHSDDIADSVKLEKDPDSIIVGECQKAQLIVRTLLRKVRSILSNLGIEDKRMLQQQAPEETTALAVVSSAKDPRDHERALVKAQDKTLPELFKQVKEANRTLAMWAGARVLEMTAAVEAIEEKVGEIAGRIRTVRLYAGLAEDIKLVLKGEPAAADERLRIMQRRCYMDEESLLDYTHGGMEFKNIDGFDRWLSKKHNLNRILPFPRCMVAFRVRRHVKERDWDGSFAGVFWIMHQEQADKFTYMYIRNGDRLHRLATDLEFGPRLFPSKTELVIGEKMWGSGFTGIDELITDREYQEIVRERREAQRKAKAWDRAHPKKDHWRNPHNGHRRDDDHHPYDPSSVYFDDMDKIMKDRIVDYNLIAYIVQGLFDRSEVLHPHPQARLWTQDGFDAAVELVHDDDNVLAPSAAPPSWEEYRAACNVSLWIGSVTIGQERAWLQREARKYNALASRDRRHTSERELEEYSPYGDPGPGRIGTVSEWMPKARNAVFRWRRERSWHSKQRVWDASDYIDESIRVGADQLFNVSAYRPGDYLQFFQDPRTRSQYLRWANYLLSAEEYHSGNPKFQPEATLGSGEGK